MLGVAQCQPDTTNFEFFNPPPDQLPCVVRNAPYDAVVQFFCPPAVAGVTIDSIHIYSINQLPAGLIYQGVPSDGKVKAWDHACLSISGTTSVQPGTYTLQSNGMAFTSAGTFPFGSLAGSGLLPPWELRVVEQAADCLPNAISSPSDPSPFPYRWLMSARQFVPNPDFMFTEESVYVQLVDALGKTCFHAEQNSATAFALPQDLPKGNYILLVRMGDRKHTMQFAY